MLLRHPLPPTSSYAMDQTFACWIVSYKHSHSDSIVDFFLRFHSMLKQYGDWIKPLQYRLHLSTVECVIRLYYSFQAVILILRTHRVQGVTAALCFVSGSGFTLPFPRPLKLLCQRCYLSLRRVQFLATPCYWCEMLQDLGYHRS